MSNTDDTVNQPAGPYEGFGGKVGRTFAGSESWWPERPTPGPDAPNIVIIVADDLGFADLSCYGRREYETPVLDALARQGTRFTDAYANSAVCTATRVALITGRYQYRLPVGLEEPLGQRPIGLPPEHPTMPSLLRKLGYRTSLIGKWHLGAGASGPSLFGFEHHAGLLIGAVQDYFSWSRTVDGVTATSTTYATTAQVDDALAWLATAGPRWFLQVAFIAPHQPFHAPPAALHHVELGESPTDDALFSAMLQALDTELGRLLAGVDLDHTVVVFIGDNGTDRAVARARRQRAKSSLYEGGIHVPLIIAGPGVRAGRVSAIVNATDLYATLIALAGGDEGAVDATSLTPYLTDPVAPPQRPYIRSDQFHDPPTAADGRTIRDARYKLIDFTLADAELYDLRADPTESQPLDAADPAVRAEIDRLMDALDAQEAGE
ncbi:MAG: sulfatase-like hydrolase/transferase [Acidimicrobiales bacterium]|nr:sulfatase-like hydrolase/transferase [Acidimicrobiales bacterium]